MKKYCLTWRRGFEQVDIFLLNQFTLEKVLCAPFHHRGELENKKTKLSIFHLQNWALTLPLSFSLHHLSLFVNEWPNNLTCNIGHWIGFFSNLNLPPGTFSVPKAIILVPFGPKGSWPPSSNWQCLQVTWGSKYQQNNHIQVNTPNFLSFQESFAGEYTLIFLPTLPHTRRLLSCTVCEHSGFIIKWTSCKIEIKTNTTMQKNGPSRCARFVFVVVKFCNTL